MAHSSYLCLQYVCQPLLFHDKSSYCSIYSDTDLEGGCLTLMLSHLLSQQEVIPMMNLILISMLAILYIHQPHLVPIHLILHHQPLLCLPHMPVAIQCTLLPNDQWAFICAAQGYPE